MEYVLFVLVTATLFLRPAEIIPALIGLPIYNYLILSCLIVSAPKIMAQLQPDMLKRRPVTIGVLGMVVAVAASHFVRLDLWSTRTYTVDYIKIILYYLLLVSTVNSLGRLKQFMYWIVLFTIILSGLAVGHFHEYFEIPALEALQDWDFDPTTGERVRIRRLCGTGIFNDPNDLSMILVLSMVICGMGLLDRGVGLARFAWLVPLSALTYTLTLTQSRGGFLAMVIGGYYLFCNRYGLIKSLIVAAVILPAVAVVFGGRQTDISGALAGGTGHSRIELWSEGLQMLRQSPIFGVGFRQYTDHAELVAHNAFIHCFGELGVFGGVIFIAMFWLAFRTLWQLGTKVKLLTLLTGSREVTHPQPFLTAAVLAYMVSLMSLSRSYALPTYLILGLVTAYQGIVAQNGIRADVKLDGRELTKILAVSGVFLLLIYLYIRIGYR